MLTGMLPTKNRFLDYKTFVEKEVPKAITLPQLFKNNNYTTISNGKIYHHLDDKEIDWDEVWRPYAFDENNKDMFIIIGNLILSMVLFLGERSIQPNVDIQPKCEIL